MSPKPSNTPQRPTPDAPPTQTAPEDTPKPKKHRRPPGKPAGQEDYERILEAFRLYPESPTKAARKAGVDYRTAVKVFNLGIPKLSLPPVQDVIAREQSKARAEVARKEDGAEAAVLTAREAAISQAAKVRAQEVQLVSVARASALQAVASTAFLAQAGRTLAEKVKDEVDKLSRGKVSATQGLELLNRMATHMVKVNNAAEVAIRLERVLAGDPTHMPAGTIPLRDDIPLEELEARMLSAQCAFESAKRAGGLRVIDGGLAKPIIGQLVSGDDVPEEEDTGDDFTANVR